MSNAINTYKEAMENGDHSACSPLVNLFWSEGEAEKAGELLKSGAESGAPEAIINYIYFLTKHEDASKGFTYARKWLEKLLAHDCCAKALNDIIGNAAERNLWCENETIAEWFYHQADLGNRDAQYCLGLLYSRGLGVERDDAKAREFFDAGECGDDPEKYLKLGQSYENGIAKIKDYKAARRCYEKSVELGNRFALLNLAKLYANGFGVKQNYAKAWECVHQAFLADKSKNYIDITKFIHENKIDIPASFRPHAEADDPQAQLYYGLLLYNGYGIEENEVEARSWIKRSADQGNQNARQFFGFFEKGAEEGDPVAQFRLGMTYATDKFLHPKNIQKAREWLEKSAMQGLAKSQFQLGKLYANEFKDGDEAIKWLKEAIKNGHKKAHHELGLVYYDGKGIAPNYDLAEKEFKLAADAGIKRAFLGLGRIYKNITHEYARAFKCFEDSIDTSFRHSNYKGLFEIEAMLKEGLLTPQEQERAKELRYDFDCRD